MEVKLTRISEKGQIVIPSSLRKAAKEIGLKREDLRKAIRDVRNA